METARSAGCRDSHQSSHHRRGVGGGVRRLAESSRRIAARGVAVDVVDGELLCTEKTLVLYVLGTPTDDLRVLASELGQGREFNVLFNSVLEVAAPVASCGGGGGCSAK